MAKCANIPMDTCIIANITTMQRCGCYANISMNISTIMNVLTMQLGTSCSFDSPGLARNEPTSGNQNKLHLPTLTF